MPWGSVDDGLYDHPKLDALGSSKLPCVGLYMLAISWSNRYLTDGFVPTSRVQKLGGTVALAEKLVQVGLFERAGEDYRVHDFHDFNDTAAAVRERRRTMRALGKRGGVASAEARRLNRDASSATLEPQGLTPVPIRSVPVLSGPPDASKSDAQRRFDLGVDRTRRLIQEQEDRKARIFRDDSA